MSSDPCMLPVVLAIVALEEFCFHSNIAIEETIISIIMTTSYIVKDKRTLILRVVLLLLLGGYNSMASVSCRRCAFPITYYIASLLLMSLCMYMPSIYLSPCVCTHVCVCINCRHILTVVNSVMIIARFHSIVHNSILITFSLINMLIILHSNY